MGIQINRREVLHNLIRFKDNLLENEKSWTRSDSKSRMYVALFNRHTGEIRFADQVAASQRFSDWEEILLVAEDAPDAIHFHVRASEGNSLKPNDFDAFAVSILFETLDVLNQLAAQYRAISERLVFEHLSDLSLTAVPESIELMKGWMGSLNRIEAEKKLFGRPLGTYLLRHGDAMTDELAHIFSSANNMFIRLYLLTFVEDEERIGDRLLINSQWGWTTGCDAPDLSSPVYEYHVSISALIHSMKHQLRAPI